MRLGFALLLFLFTSVGLAQAPYPNKPVRIVVTFTPGGAADFTARLLADKWSELWQQQVIVENRIGAGGSIGAEAVQKAPATASVRSAVRSRRFVRLRFSSLRANAALRSRSIAAKSVADISLLLSSVGRVN